MGRIGGSMEFGKISTTKILDDEGSTVTECENVFDSQPVKPIRRTYEIRTRVNSQSKEHTAYIKFSDDLLHDKTKLDPYFRIERTISGDKEGYYYVVCVYTQLIY